MDDLVQARAELARLEAKAQTLVKELLGVRAAVFAQRTRIDELIRHRSPSIQRLPTELLSYILNLEVRAHTFHGRKQELARVSRRWRDIILDDPVFWTTINIPALSTSAIQTHLKKSGESLLDIVIQVHLNDLERSYKRINSRLDIIKPYAYRWGSLDAFDVVYGRDSDDDEDDDEDPAEVFIVKAIGHLELPSLKRATISFFDDIPYPGFLSQTRAPSLEHLELQCPTWVNFSPPLTLKTLDIIVAEEYIGSAPGLSFIPTQTLTTLSLGGVFNNLSFQPNSIHFPVLDTLTLSSAAANGLMQAIVAPNLECFTYSSFREESPPSFTGLGSKFTRVRRFCFFVLGGIMEEFPDYDHGPLCEAFPNVCHAEFNSWDLIGLLTARRRGDESIYRHIDLWKNLKNLAVGNLGFESRRALYALANWLTLRWELGLPLLHVKIINSLPEAFELLYGFLRDHCLLEFEDSGMKSAHLSKLAHSSPWMVSTPCPSWYGKFIHLQRLGTDSPSELISSFTSSFLESNCTRDW